MNKSVQGVVVSALSPGVPAIAAPSPQEIDVPAGESVSVDVAVVRQDGTAFDLTGCQVLLTIKARAADANPIVSRQATSPFVSTTGGLCSVPLAYGDTLLAFGPYVWDLWLTDANGARQQIVPLSPLVVTPSAGQPAQPVTVLPTQVPLAQGPAGPGVPADLTVSTLRLAAATPSMTHLYVAAGGSDANVGSLASPFLTLQHAVNAAAVVAAAGQRVTIHTSRSETTNVVFPPFLNPSTLLPSYPDAECSAFIYKGAITIQSAPTLVDTLGVGATVAPDAVNASQVRITDASKSYGAGALVGDFVVGALPFEFGCVRANGATTVDVQSLNGTFTAPIRIYSLGATITGGTGTGPALTLDGVKAKVVLAGLNVTHQDANTAAVQAEGADSLTMLMCSTSSGMDLSACGHFRSVGSAWIGLGGGTTYDFKINAVRADLTSLYALRTTPILTGGFCGVQSSFVEDSRWVDAAGGSISGLAFTSTSFLRQGLVVMGECEVQNVRADACVSVAHVNPYGSGVRVLGGNLSIAEGLVGGGGNAGAGLEVDVGTAYMENGEVVTFSITGALGDLKVGRLSPIAWATAIAQSYVSDPWAGSFFGVADDAVLGSPQRYGQVTSSGATPATLVRVRVPTGKLLRVEADLSILGRRTDGGGLNDYCAMLFRTAWQNVGGVLTNVRVGGDFPVNAESIGTLATCTMQSTASGTDVLIQVVGAAGATIDWAGWLSTVIV